MKASDLHLNELISTSDGNIVLHGRRLVLHSIHAFARFRKDIIDMLGVNHARRMFTRFGYFWGQADAVAMKRVFGWDNLVEWLKAGPRLNELEGIARVQVNRLDMDEKEGRLHMEVVWHDSGEAEGHLMEIGRSTYPVCWKLTGYVSGFASFCMKKGIYFIEKQCLARGDSRCVAVGKDLESWGDEIAHHLPYFEAEDIEEYVARLTAELQRKSEALADQQERIDMLTRRPGPFFVEGHSKALRQVLDLARRVAQFDSSVLITGETGVGKEVLANFIHGLSHRAKGQFVAINCSALPETLLESELFGYRAGSFTGAIRDRIGLLEKSGGGTVFLDEIGDITPAMQVKILRVLQEKEITRIGENEPRKIDVRIIAATHQDLDTMVAEGRFRDDLLYRLRVIEIDVPPLRNRREDILPLARHLLVKLAKKLNIPRLQFDVSCVDYLQSYQWPGNVRELENALERAAVFSRDGIIMPEHLPPHIISQVKLHVKSLDPLTRALAEIENEHILAVLNSSAGNKARAAEILGISPATLWRRLKKIGREA